MRHLRMLLNVVIGGGVFAAYLTVLFLQLNPGVPLAPVSVAGLALPLLASYGVSLALVAYVLLLLRHLLAEQALSPGWLSFQVLVWLCLVAAGIAATVTWLNLSGLRVTLDDDAARRMALGAVVLTIAVALLLVLGIFRFSFGRGRAGPVVFALVLFASIAVPVALRGPARELAQGVADADPPSFAASSGGRLMLVVMDGASLDFISPAAAAGRLPNLGRILEEGAVMHLATLRPTQPAPVLTSIATGKLPMATGVRSAASYRARTGPVLEVLPDYCFARGLVAAGVLEEHPHSSASLRARPVWAILAASGVAPVVVRWPLTFPAPAAEGTIVSDRLHLPDGEPAQATYPTDLLARLRRIPEAPDAASAAAALVAPGAEPYAGGAALALDRLYGSALNALRESGGARFLAIRYVGLDTMGHEYLRQAMPRAFGDVPEEERRKYGTVLEQYYRFVDAEIGRALDWLHPDDLLLVVSPFGMEPLSPPKRILELALGHRESGTHERAPDGFLLAYGTSVRAARLARASVLDVTPTVLYYFGLPIGRDMAGSARPEIFTRSFTAARPLAFIPTYDR